MASLLICGLLSICLSCVMSAPMSNNGPYKMIDMSYPYVENATLSWPGMKPYVHKRVHWGVFGSVPFVGYYDFETGEHVGTHMDAPKHFNEKGHTVDQVPLSTTVGEAVVINITAKVEKNPDYKFNITDLEDWEKKHGRMPENPIVFMYSGYGKYWPNWETYLGSKTPNDTESLHFPGMTPEAATWLVTERNLKMYGVDVVSIDAGSESIYFPVHIILSKHNIPGIENVANLHLLPARGAEVFAAPMKMKDGTGGPTRLFARIGPNKVNKVVNGGTALTSLNSGTATILLVAILTVKAWFMF